MKAIRRLLRWINEPGGNEKAKLVVLHGGIILLGFAVIAAANAFRNTEGLNLRQRGEQWCEARGVPEGDPRKPYCIDKFWWIADKHLKEFKLFKGNLKEPYATAFWKSKYEGPLEAELKEMEQIPFPGDDPAYKRKAFWGNLAGTLIFVFPLSLTFAWIYGGVLALAIWGSCHAFKAVRSRWKRT